MNNNDDETESIDDEELDELLDRIRAQQKEDPRRPLEDLPHREQAVEDCMMRIEELLKIEHRRGLDSLLFEYQTLRKLPKHASKARVKLAVTVAQAYHETVEGEIYGVSSHLENALEYAEDIDEDYRP